jgi:orsellinic acid C2-O-methyltransferase
MSQTDQTPPARQLSELINGFWATQAISTAVSLGIPDVLAVGPRTAESIAESVSAHAPSVFRLMRGLQTLGICQRLEDGRFELTASGELLRADVPGSLRGRALFNGGMLWKQFGDLSHCVKTGGRMRAHASGEEGFNELASDPVRLASFQKAMAESSIRATRDAMKVYDFGQFASVLDLGGGYGGVLSVLLTAYPGMTGAVCDLAYLTPTASEFLAHAGVGERGRFLGGNFFEAVPRGYDAYIMKYILHDWDDEHALRILNNCRAVAADATKVVLLEQLVPKQLGTGFTDQAVIRADLTMLGVGGKERTVEEYGELFASTGWRLSSVTPTAGEFSVLEAVTA